MRKKQWIKIDDSKIRGDTYEFLGGGATAYTYVNNLSNKLVKIIIGSQYKTDEEFIKECEKEVEFQNRAANEDLAPTIYFHGLIEQKKSIFRDYDNVIVPYYYIVMEYLSENKGWEHVFPDDMPEDSCNFIYNLIKKTGLINIKDPDTHFYFNSKFQKMYMIDYGNCEECHFKNENDILKCMNPMTSILRLNCKTKSTTGGYLSKKRTIKRRQKRIINHKHKSIKRKSIKRKSIKRKSIKRKSIKRKSINRK